MDTPSAETQAAIIKDRIQLWQNTQYQAGIDLRVAGKISDEQMRKAALEQVRRAEIALTELRAALAELTLD